MRGGLNLGLKLTREGSVTKKAIPFSFNTPGVAGAVLKIVINRSIICDEAHLI